MKCLHCGYCCMMLDVIIINPEFVEEITNEVFTTFNEDYNKFFIHKENNKACPYLTFDNGKYFCSIHDKPWFSFTPCHRYTQIGREESLCRIGDSITKETKTGLKLKNNLTKIYKGDN